MLSIGGGGGLLHCKMLKTLTGLNSSSMRTMAKQQVLTPPTRGHIRNSSPALVATTSMDASPRCTLVIRAHEPIVLTNHMHIFYALQVRTRTI